MVQDNAELAVLVDVAAGLLPLGLKRLNVLLLSVAQASCADVVGLMQLAKLRALAQLRLDLTSDWVDSRLREQADNLLMALNGIACVEVYTPVETDAQILRAAKARLLDLGLPCPRDIAFGTGTANEPLL